MKLIYYKTLIYCKLRYIRRQLRFGSYHGISVFMHNPDISTPIVNRIDVESIKVFEKMFDTTYDKFVKIAFRMTISDLIDSVMVQLYPIRFAKDMCNKFYTKENAANNE